MPTHLTETVNTSPTALFEFTSAGSGVTIGPSATFGTDNIVEYSSGNGITIDGVKLKDSGATLTAALTLTTQLGITSGGTGASTAATARTNIGLGSMATQDATAVAITGGAVTVTGVTVSSDPSSDTMLGNRSYNDTRYISSQASLVMRRSAFEYSGTTCMRIHSGKYYMTGVTKTIYWNRHLDFVLGPAGSNPSSSAASANAWHYIYMSYSYVNSTSLSEVTSPATFLNSTSAPTQYDAFGGTWLSAPGTLNQCIMAVWLGAGSGVSEFSHDGGDYVLFAEKKPISQGADYYNVWTDTSGITIPAFSRVAEMSAWATGNAAQETYALWRTNGTTGTSGHQLTGYFSNAVYASGNVKVITDSSQKIEVMITSGAANVNQLYLWTDGWYFPQGM